MSEQFPRHFHPDYPGGMKKGFTFRGCRKPYEEEKYEEYSDGSRCLNFLYRTSSSNPYIRVKTRKTRTGSECFCKTDLCNGVARFSPNFNTGLLMLVSLAYYGL